LLQAIAAKDTDGSVCCEWVGSNGAGHYVKMVHNGIEYGDMQLICEAYQLLRTGLDMTPAEIQSVFQEWNRGGLSGYLTEITGNILGYLDTDNVPLIDKILDAAGQKGTGKWTVNAALNEGIDLSLISEAVFARCISAMKEERVYASTLLEGPSKLLPGDRKMWIDWVADALYAGKIVSYAQGFSLLKSAAKTNHWDLDYSKISLLWRGGCIIRSAFLKDITAAFNLDPSLPNLLCDEHFRKIIHKTQTGWRNVCANAMLCGIPIPAMSASLSFYDSYRSERLPANLLQAQRDYFGAHTYQRLDAPLSQFFHTNWTSEGGSTASSVYSV
jgi:6-phosphogluconate dehydrogenase